MATNGKPSAVPKNRVRTALVTAATVATLMGAQSLAFNQRFEDNQDTQTTSILISTQLTDQQPVNTPTVIGSPTAAVTTTLIPSQTPTASSTASSASSKTDPATNTAAGSSAPSQTPTASASQTPTATATKVVQPTAQPTQIAPAVQQPAPSTRSSQRK